MMHRHLQFLVSYSLILLFVISPLTTISASAKHKTGRVKTESNPTAKVSEKSPRSSVEEQSLETPSNIKADNVETSPIGKEKTNESNAKIVKSSLVEMPERKPGQSATLLSDGRWLLIGGEEEGRASASLVVVGRNDDKVILLPIKLKFARSWHTATILPDGKVIIFGGFDANGQVVEAAELLDPVSQTLENIALTGLTARAAHTATLLTDGRVLIVGGKSADLDTLNSAEFWNSRTKAVYQVNANLHTARSKHSAALMPSGNVVVWRGVDENGNELADGEEFDLNSQKFRYLGVVTPQQDPNPPYLVASLPREGDQGVPLDTRIALRFSKPLQPETVDLTNFTLNNGIGNIPAKIVAAENGMLVFITPQEPLAPGTNYTVSISGAKDRSGLELLPSLMGFTTVDDRRPPIKHPSDHGGHGNQKRVTHDAMQKRDFKPRKGRPDAEEWIPDEKNRRKWRSGEPLSEKQTPLPLLAEKDVTALSGRVVTLQGKPLANVSMQLGGVETRSDDTGRFLLAKIPAGHQVLIINGGTADSGTKQYAMFDYGVEIKQGITTVMPFQVWLPVIDTINVTELPELTLNRVVAKTQRIPGLEVHVPSGARLRYPRGETLRNLTITPIPINRPPFPLPPGAEDGVLFTLQLHSAKVEDASGNPLPGLQVIYPNTGELSAGERVPLWNYDPHSKRGWYIYGYGTVTSDEQQVIPDAGTELQSMHCISYMGNPGKGPAEGPPPGGGSWFGDPVEASTGLFVYDKTDFFVPDTIPISLTRTYRQRDTQSRSFGVGATHPYAMFLVGGSYYGTGGYIEIILPNGGRIRFDSDPANPNGWLPHTATPTAFYGARMTLNTVLNTYDVRLSSGTIYRFLRLPGPIPAGGGITDLKAVIDRYGNELKIENNKIITPNGRWVELTIDANKRITQAKDNIGRIYTYEYDANGRLWKVTDPANKVSEYTYDGFGQMLTIKDERNIVFLTNEYDTNGRVFRQTQADNTTYQFAYTLDTGGKVTQTDVTDPRGLIERVTFNAKGYWLTHTSAVSKPEQQTATCERNPNNFPLKLTDALGRKSTFGYDAKGNITSLTGMAETTGARTTTFTYESVFNKVTSVTDPLNHTTTFGYDANGNLTSYKDALLHESTFGYNSKGQLVSATDPLGGSVQFVYQGADLIEIKGSLNRSLTQSFDEAGRVTSMTNALGQTTRIQYDVLNRPLRVMDPLGRETVLEYNESGHLLSVTDARLSRTSYTYNNMDRVETRTDPLLKVESYQYDQNGNVKKYTDRRGKVTTLRYDNLDRLSFVGYGTVGEGETATFESTVNRTYDAAHRLTQIADSASGTITHSYNDLERTSSETTPQGTVSYAFDAAGRQTAMTVAGQPAVAYSYDNADRLTAISQGALNVGFNYDNASRLTRMTLPNGIAVEADYDGASRVSQLRYKRGTTQLGSLVYGYNKIGQVTSIGGSFARTLLPQASGSTVNYNASNRLTQRGATNFTYDDEGNLTSDGTNTYTWNARNQLASISGTASASFAYDAFGRRTGRTVNGQTVNYLYDGANIVQEQNNASTPTANLLTGGVDTVFARSESNGGTTTTYTPITDALGSTMALLDAAGVAQAEYNYEPFGKTNTTGSTTNTSKYTGREDDGGTELYYYRARYYSPSLQRFISEDPIGLSGGINLYAYVGNNPINNSDPSGLIPTILIGRFKGPSTLDGALDEIQLYLGLAGMIPGAGEPFDAIDTGISAARGDAYGVALGTGSMLPFGGAPAGMMKIGRRLPANWKFAGKNYPASELPADIQSKYPNGVDFTDDGFPNFAPYVKTNVQVDGLRGDTYHDFINANKATGYDSTPQDYVWHHHQNGRTMQLVPKDLHDAVRHTGGGAIIRNKQ